MSDANAYAREILEAVTERGWRLVAIDTASGIVIEEPSRSGLKLTIEGLTLSAGFIRTLPEARTPTPIFATSDK